MKLFDMDGPLMAALNKISDLVFANLLFLVFSLPVVTIGASLTALQTVVLDIARDQEGSIRRRFWQAFRSHFKQSTLLWLIFLAGALVLVGSYAAASTLGESFARFYAVVLGALGIVLLLWFQFLFPLQSIRPAQVRQTAKTAFLLMILRLPYAVGMLLVVVAAVYLSFFLNPNTIGGATFLWLALGFALVTYCNAFLVLRAFRDLPELAEEETT